MTDDYCPRYRVAVNCPWEACTYGCVAQNGILVAEEEHSHTSEQLDAFVKRMAQLKADKTLSRITRLPGVSNDPTTRDAIRRILEDS